MRDFLRQVRGRLRLRAMADAGAGVAAVAGLAGLVLLGVAGAGRPSPWWALAGWGFGAAVVAATAGIGIAAFRRWRADEAVARFVGQRTASGDLVLSAVELGGLLPTLEIEP